LRVRVVTKVSLPKDLICVKSLYLSNLGRFDLTLGNLEANP
jgi:hypothetical protein